MLKNNGKLVLLVWGLLNNGLLLAMDGELLSGMNAVFGPLAACGEAGSGPRIRVSRSDGRLDELINVRPTGSGSAATLLRLTSIHEVDRIYSTHGAAAGMFEICGGTPKPVVGGLDSAHKQAVFLLAARLDGQAGLLATQQEKINQLEKRIFLLEKRPEGTRCGLWARLCCCI